MVELEWLLWTNSTELRLRGEDRPPAEATEILLWNPRVAQVRPCLHDAPEPTGDEALAEVGAQARVSHAREEEVLEATAEVVVATRVS